MTKTTCSRHVASALCLIALFAGRAFAEAEVDFNRDIRPILASHCYACHGPDERARKADLRLDQREAALESGVISPGKPDESELVSRVFSTDSELLMPPDDTGHRLNAREKQLLKSWVADGAEYKVHWSFTPPQKHAVPQLAESAWPRHAIDHFVLTKLKQAGLTPSEKADRYQLIRRVSLDLTGLPPTPEEADAFVADSSANAFEKVVDRLLTSEAYGEHWARMWLDLARYADTKGYEKDRPRLIWKYRDWVINALNQDMPFDQFTTEQLAGDLLNDPTSDQLIATAFHRNTMTNDEGGTDNEEFRVAAVKDRVDTTVQVWMGLTMGCAKCHSHKYDPISNRDYYSFYAFFNQTQDTDRPDDAPLLPLPTDQQQKEITRLETEIREFQKALKGKPEDSEESKTLKKKLSDIQKALKGIQGAVVKTPIMRELAENKRRQTRMHVRGNFLDQGDPVEAGAPDVFGNWPSDAPLNRLGVAQWLMQPENPLTARVMVNRIWARLFGVGIVETEEDFGAQGLAPSHPELLDWLAVDFRENGWSIKQLLRSIVLSATYQQATVFTEKNLTIDPKNRLLSRGARFRLSAETIRDQSLAVSGLLTRTVGGPSVMPPQPSGVWKSTYSGLKWVNATGPNRFRRALYTYWKRTSPYPSMLTFDAGSGEVCLLRRVRTNTPLQALVLLNDPGYVEAAGALAQRMSEAKGDIKAKLDRGFRHVLIRKPKPAETDRLLEVYQSLAVQYEKDPNSASELLKAAGLTEGDAAMVTLANALLNVDEFLTRQ